MLIRSDSSSPVVRTPTQPTACVVAPTPAAQVEATPSHHGVLHKLGGILGGLFGAGKSAIHTVENLGDGALHKVEGLGAGALHTVEGLGEGALRTVEGLGEGALHKVEGLGEGLLSHFPGKYDIPAPGLPAYPKLDPAQKAAAVQRGAGKTVSQPVMQDPHGHKEEPITIQVNGSLSKLEKTLESQGWSSPQGFPMSPALVNGKGPAAILAKNQELGGMSRDHLRIFALGDNQWGIASTRDEQPFARVHDDGSLSFGHEVDKNIDGERDLVMHDLLAGAPSAASSWAVVNGHRQFDNSKAYLSDGKFYTLNLG